MKDYKAILDQYIADVTGGKIAACVWLKLAVKRFQKDLRKSKKETYQFYYDQEAADQLLSFAESLKPKDLGGKTIELLPWQIFVLSNLEGWRWKKDPERKRFRSAYIELNRKNGKTTGVLEPCVLYNFLKYKASESYLVSSRDDLSQDTYNGIRFMIEHDPTLDDLLKPQSLAVTFKDKDETSRLSFFCDGGKSVDGFKPRFCAIDEYHEYASDAMVDSMRQGMRSKTDAQLIMITTADVEIANGCYDEHLKSQAILKETQSQDDHFCVIYALDETDDYHDSSTWIKANPSLGYTIDPDIIQSDLVNAELTPHKLPEFKAKTFGIWGGGGEHSWIELEVWQQNSKIKVNWGDFIGLPSAWGLDLAQINDFTAYTNVFERNGKFFFKHRFYVPEVTLASRYRKENANIPGWVQQGYITLIPGGTIDYNWIFKDMMEDAKKYRVLGLGYDRWKAKELIDKVEETRPDLPLIEVEQSYKKLSPITQDYEKAVRDGKVIDNNPVMLWMINNVVVKPDENGNYKPLKKSKASTQRIDGVISSLMAYSVLKNPSLQTVATDFNTLMAIL